ncbi:OmpP1/FadL family transporter [Pedobacter immunditicola]|uniref:OmpP1/FadL family transporter n=1 Tax=Pedobacter immunditicola TaxID=3133440 RepID=UPI00309DB27E
MKKFTTLLALAMVASTGTIYAQYAGDALRFSQTNYGSSSRFKGLGNAQMSLGGDISSISGNPAGLGMFTRSEFSFTPEYNNTEAISNYLGQRTTSAHDKVNLNQAGIVWYNPVVKRKGSDVNKGLLSFVWGIGYNRNNDFGADYSFGGRNSQNSIADFFAEDATAYGALPLQLAEGTLGRMAYDNFLLDEVGTGENGVYQPATALNNDQFYNQVRFGSTSEFNFSGAMNISNQFYIGASVGIISVRYGYDSEFLEGGVSTLLPQANPEPGDPVAGDSYDLSYRQSQTTDGSGINGKIGIIYKPINSFRIGATFQTPTWMHIEDVYSEVLDTRFNANTLFSNDPSNSVFQYNLRTPYKGSVGASVILGENGLITADVDYIDYSSIRFTNAENNYEPTTISNNNLDVQDFYTDAFNYRVGGELRFDQLTLRAGFGINGTPYKDDETKKFETKFYSGGLGYRVNQYYIDVAYQRSETNNTFSPYVLNDFSEPVADVKLNKNNVFLTFGVRF